MERHRRGLLITLGILAFGSGLLYVIVLLATHTVLTAVLTAGGFLLVGCVAAVRRDYRWRMQLAALSTPDSRAQLPYPGFPRTRRETVVTLTFVLALTVFALLVVFDLGLLSWLIPMLIVLSGALVAFAVGTAKRT